MREVEWIIYGTAWKKERTAQLVYEAVKNGFRGVDTACQPRHYNEPQVGEAIEALSADGIDRSELYLQTKFTPVDGQDPENIPYDPGLPIKEQVKASFSVSLANLRTDYVDTYILHSPLRTAEETLQAWDAMAEIQRSGGAGRLGISNCYSHDLLVALHEIAEVKPAVVQNRFYRETAYDTLIREWCSQNEVKYQAFWTLTANPDILGSRDLQELARKYGRTVQEVFFRFLHQEGVVILTGTCDPVHMRQDLSIRDFSLERNEIALIGDLLVG